MEVPREQRCCSFEVHLVYCWPFWFNLYHQRAWLNYWQLNLFSLGYWLWVNKFLLVFLFFHSPLFFSFFFFFLLFLLLRLPRWAHLDQAWDDFVQGIHGPLKKLLFRPAQKATGWRATNQMGWFCSSFKDKMMSTHLIGPRSWSSFSMKTSQAQQTQLQLVYLSFHRLPLITVNFGHLCNFCHSRHGALHSQMSYLYSSISTWECFQVQVRWLKWVFRINGHPPLC